MVWSPVEVKRARIKKVEVKRDSGVEERMAAPITFSLTRIPVAGTG